MLLVSVLINPSTKARGMFIPPAVEENIESFKRWHPELSHRLFSLDDILELLREKFPKDVLGAFNSLRPYAYKADLARYCILHEFGGVYADLSYYFVSAMPIDKRRVVVFRDFLWSSPWDTSVGVIYSPPGHQALACAIDMVCANVKRGYYGPTALCPTGPALFGKALATACEADDVLTGAAIRFQRDKLQQRVPDLDLPEAPKIHCLGVENRLVAVKRKRMASPGLGDLGMNNGNVYYELWEARNVYVDAGSEGASGEAEHADRASGREVGDQPHHRSDPAFTIPRVIHQTWKDADIPPHYLKWQESWRACNPDYEYRLWCDGDIEELVRNDYPELLELFLSYASNISRVDLGRYLILKSFGGIYVDLDFECLRPLDELLQGREFVIGLEPQEHLVSGKGAASGLSQILCPSFIASTPGHLFWDHLLSQIRDARDAEDVLDSTGPFVLTRAYESYSFPSSVSVLPAKVLYPVDRENCDSGRVFDVEYREAATRDSYAIHYWDGSWWRAGREFEIGIQPIFPINVVGTASPALKVASAAVGKPTISCLMLVTDEVSLAELSFAGFRAQTYLNKELVLIDATGSTPAWISESRKNKSVKILRLRAEEGAGPGWIDLALQQAAGEYLCIWDAGALHDPCRLDYQLGAITRIGTDASAIGTSVIIETERRRISIGAFERWQATFLCRRSLFASTLNRLNSEGVQLRDVVKEMSVLEIDLPRLYARVGLWPDEELLPFARNTYCGNRYDAVAAELAKRLPLSRLPVPEL